MAFTARDVHEKAAELTTAGSPFELGDFDVDGDVLQGFVNAPADLVQLLQAGRAHGDKTFVVYEGRRLSFDEFFRRVDVLASQLQCGYGVRQGGRPSGRRSPGRAHVPGRPRRALAAAPGRLR